MARKGRNTEAVASQLSAVRANDRVALRWAREALGNEGEQVTVCDRLRAERKD